MKADSSVTVNYANLAYAFMKFQEQYKTICQEISQAKRTALIQSFKKANSFVFEYLAFIKSKEFRDYLITYLEKLHKEIYDDIEYEKVSHRRNKTPTEIITLNQKYFYYLIKIFKLIGTYGDELSKTFMPNKTDREKLFKYWNNNAFFEQFTFYKASVSAAIANFDLRNFKDGFSYFLGFYFAYYLFIDEESRHLSEKIFSNILNIYLNREIQTIILYPKDLSAEKKELLKDIDYNIHKGLNNIFFRCNYSYSRYGVLPRMEQKTLIDETSM
jgi:hypothetical protein